MMTRETNRRKHGFTLIELLVVIAIIALLLSILMPGLQMAKRQARKIVCKAHLHGWGTVFATYAHDSEGKFPKWYNDYDVRGNMWMDVLIPYYDDITKLRFCAEAMKEKDRGPDSPLGTYGSAHMSWLHKTPNGQIGPYEGVMWSNGSYGINHYVYGFNEGVTVWTKDMGPNLPWGTIGGTGLDSQVPLLFDCTWAGTFPSVTDMPPKDGDGIEGLGIANEMARVALNRHGKESMTLFMDLSVTGVYLPDLWKLKWHRKWRQVHYTREDFRDADGNIWLP